MKQPYLEEHHVIWLSQGVTDTIDNTVALCPNCYRKMHVVANPDDVKKLMKFCNNKFSLVLLIDEQEN